MVAVLVDREGCDPVQYHAYSWNAITLYGDCWTIVNVRELTTTKTMLAKIPLYICNA